MSETGATTTPASQLASSYSGGAWPLEGVWHSDFSWLKNSVFFPPQTAKTTKILCLRNLAPHGMELFLSTELWY